MFGNVMVLAAVVGVSGQPVDQPCYKASTLMFASPVLSWLDGNSRFGQVFNPSWIEASPDGAVPSGLLVRAQNCSVGFQPPACGLEDPDHPSDPTKHSCCACNMASDDDDKAKRSVLAFARVLNMPEDPAEDPVFAPITAADVVFAPIDEPPLNDDLRGTEDPRVAFDRSTGLYHMFYTCFARTEAKYAGSLCHATTRDPSSADSWTRLGPAFEGEHKSGALLVRESPPHYLYSGAGQIHLAQSDNLLNWTLGDPFLTSTSWGNPNVEAGPPPLRLADGNYIFFFNSWGGQDVPPPGYQPAWVVLSGDDPTHILASAPAPLWSPSEVPWMAGTAEGAQCNVPQVAFLEAAHGTSQADVFRVYFGGADAVIGTATVTVERVTGVQCL